MTRNMGLVQVLSFLLTYLGVAGFKLAASMTGGLVGVAKFAVLPQVEPFHTAILVLAAQVCPSENLRSWFSMWLSRSDRIVSPCTEALQLVHLRCDGLIA
jgi:hypothetical protein